MPLLDVTELLTDPDFVQTVTLTRRVQTVGANGVASSTGTDTDIVASVQPDMGKVVRGADGEYAAAKIVVYSRARLLGVTNSKYPDVITWKGQKYLVIGPRDWNDWGAGFTAADCELMDLEAEA